jgi:chorismate mutase-like protein
MSDFDGWRKRIDEIDKQLVKLLNERSKCAVEIGHLKKKRNMPAWQPDREAEILRNVVKSNHGPLDDAAIRRLFERIIDEARALERHAMESGGTQGKE